MRTIDGDQQQIDRVCRFSHGLSIRRVDENVGTELLGQITLGCRGGKGSDGATAGLGKEDGHVAEPTDSNDADTLARSAVLLERMEDSDAAAHQRSSVFRRESLGDLECPVGGHVDDFGEASDFATSAGDDGLGADGTFVGQTAGAPPAGVLVCPDANAITGNETANCVACLGDHTDYFVARDSREGGETPVIAVDVDIGGANAASFDADLDFKGAEGREFNLDVFDRETGLCCSPSSDHLNLLLLYLLLACQEGFRRQEWSGAGSHLNASRRNHGPAVGMHSGAAGRRSGFRHFSRQGLKLPQRTATMRPRLICNLCRSLRRQCDLEARVLARAMATAGTTTLQSTPSPPRSASSSSLASPSYAEIDYSGLCCERCFSRGATCAYETPDADAVAKIVSLQDELLLEPRIRRKKRARTTTPPTSAAPPKVAPSIGYVNDSIGFSDDAAAAAATFSNGVGSVAELPPHALRRGLSIYRFWSYASIPVLDLSRLGDDPFQYLPEGLANAVIALALHCLGDELVYLDEHRHDGSASPNLYQDRDVGNLLLELASSAHLDSCTVGPLPEPELSAEECYALAGSCLARATEVVRGSVVPVPGDKDSMDPHTMLWNAVTLLHISKISSVRNTDRRVAEHFCRLALAEASTLDTTMTMAHTHDGEVARRLLWCLYISDRSGLLRASTGRWIVPEELLAGVPLPRPYDTVGMSTTFITIDMLSTPEAVSVLLPLLDGYAILAFLHTLRSKSTNGPAAAADALLLLEAAESALSILTRRPYPGSAQAWTLLPDAGRTRFSHIKPDHLIVVVKTFQMLLHTPGTMRAILSDFSWLASPDLVKAMEAALGACETTKEILASDPTASDAMPFALVLHDQSNAASCRAVSAFSAFSKPGRGNIG